MVYSVDVLPAVVKTKGTDVTLPDPTLCVYEINLLEHQLSPMAILRTTSDAIFKLGSARDEKISFSSDKCTIFNRQRGSGFWLVPLLLISQEGKVTMSVTLS